MARGIDGMSTARRTAAGRRGGCHPRMALLIVAAGLVAGGSALVVARPASADVSIQITLATSGCLLQCYTPNPASATTNDVITWTDGTGLVASLKGTGRVTHTTFTAAFTPAHTASTRLTTADTYDYGEGGTGAVLVITAAPASSSSGSGTGTSISPVVQGAVLQPGQKPGQVTGPAAAKPKIIANKPVGTVSGPGALGPQGSTALPPITSTATPDPGSLPPITASVSSPTPRPLASAPTASTGGGRSGLLYAGGALIFLLIAAAGSGFYGLRWWRRRSADAAPAPPSAAS